jgi:hypothetical protein
LVQVHMSVGSTQFSQGFALRNSDPNWLFTGGALSSRPVPTQSHTYPRTQGIAWEAKEKVTTLFRHERDMP